MSQSFPSPDRRGWALRIAAVLKLTNPKVVDLSGVKRSVRDSCLLPDGYRCFSERAQNPFYRMWGRAKAIDRLQTDYAEARRVLIEDAWECFFIFLNRYGEIAARTEMVNAIVHRLDDVEAVVLSASGLMDRPSVSPPVPDEPTPEAWQKRADIEG
jgi:hypothetical protein